MIFTVTFNPAADYILKADAVNHGGLCRCSDASVFFSGKGINVASVLQSLGVSVTAVTFLGGFVGDELERQVGKRLPLDVIRITGLTRINVKLHTSDERESELNAPGAPLGEEELSRLFGKLDRMKSGDTLVISGSIPPGLKKSVYGDVFSVYADRNIRFCADCAGELLLGTLPYRPFVIKPNVAELIQTFGKEINSDADCIAAAEGLRSMGAENVLVTMGGDGALLAASNGGVYRAHVPSGSVVSTVGAGDSALAGFLAGYDSFPVIGEDSSADIDPSDLTRCDNTVSERFTYALRLAAAAGTATARSAVLAEKDEIYSLLDSIKVERIL